MTMGREEAASALDAVARSRRHAAELRGYSGAGSILIAWGLAWLAGNFVSQFRPSAAAIVWLIGIVTATLWSMTRPGRAADWRVAATIAAVVSYVLLMLIIARVDARAANAAVSLLVAATYVVLGVWTGIRFAVLGLALCAVVLLGWFLVPAWLFLCLAIGGGGTLLLGGLWLRRA